MRELLLMRHAKSDWSAQSGTDRDRPLNERGRLAAAAMGRAITRAGKVPVRVLTSPALRAATTSELATAAGGWPCVVVEDEAIYGDGVDGLIDAVRRNGSDANRLMVVGHQPTISTVLSHLIDGGAVRFPTGAVAGLRLFIEDWSDLGANQGELDFLFTPRVVEVVRP